MGTNRIHVGTLVVTANIAAYAAQSGPNWLAEFDLDPVQAPFTLEIRCQDNGSAVTTVGVQAKLQHQPVPDGQDPDSALWIDADDGSAVETAALTAEGVSRRHSAQKFGGRGRVLLVGTSADWQTDGQTWDVFLYYSN